MSVEFVHTYSLIHDDLPCMDDDDERRGKPTNHKVFGEDVALIAGDALLTEAFHILATSYSDAELVRSLVRNLSRASGYRGMVGGQAIDLVAQKTGISTGKLRLLHEMKTGALIQVSVEGASLIASTSAKNSERLSGFGSLVGLAFQVADDLLDYSAEGPEKGNYATVTGLVETQLFLRELTQQALLCLEPWGEKAEVLRDIVEFNAQRTK